MLSDFQFEMLKRKSIAKAGASRYLNKQESIIDNAEIKELQDFFKDKFESVWKRIANRNKITHRKERTKNLDYESAKRSFLQAING